MAYEITFTPKASRTLKNLDLDLKEKLSKIIDGLAENPRPDNATNFRGVPKGYRIREGNYRVIYQVFDSELLINVLVIGDRKESYRKKHR